MRTDCCTPPSPPPFRRSHPVRRGQAPRRPLGEQPSLDRNHFYVLYEDDVVRVDRGLGKVVAVIDLDELGELASIPGTSGKVIQLKAFE